ncbi:MAG TPA: metalloregulator ArsR/SmtB family transcription factor [Micromonosporaceae bacterium]
MNAPQITVPRHETGVAGAGYEAAGELLRALAAPIRIAIVTELGAGPRCVHEIVDAVHAPQPLVSQHLRVLRGAGVVRGERRGREIAYSLTDEHIGHIVADAINHTREAR